MSTRRHVLFASCAPGIEPLLHDELRALRVARLERQVGGARFEGTWADVWRVNLELRTAVRVLLRLSRFRAADADALYDGVAAFDWSELLRPEGRLWVDARVSDSSLSHSRFVAQRVKDAIVDQLRERTGARPTIEREAPDLRLHVHVHADRVTLSVDTSGESLHRRGWRRAQGRAPLSECLAAALVLHAGWDRRSPLLDPFAGSGTLLAEAALLATDSAPGLTRERFGFETLPGHDAGSYRRLRASIADRRRPASKVLLRGTDVDPERVAELRANLAGLDVEVRFETDVADARAFEPRRGWNAWIVTNPPYGQRLGGDEDLVELYRAFGVRLREACQGYTLGLITAHAELAKALALRGLERASWVHGGLDVRVLTGVI